MPFREKAKSLFRTRSKTESNSLSKTSSSDSSSTIASSTTARWPSNVYKPGEPMPRPKYRAVPKKEHKDKLDAFSFPEAWRRRSFQSQHSPMGTRAPSRRNSIGASRQNSTFSLSKKGSSRTNSATSIDTDGLSASTGGRERGMHSGAANISTLSGQPEQEGDSDAANVGKVVSRPQSSYVPSSSQRAPEITVTASDIPRHVPTTTTAHDHARISETDLELALTRSQTTVPTR